MRNMKRLLFFVLMTVCSVSWAEWEITDYLKNGEDTFYHDKSTKRKTGAIVRMWTLRNYSIVQTERDGDRYMSAKELIAYDCRSETFAMVSAVWYSGPMGKGDTVRMGTFKENDWKWNPIVPDTIGENEWKIACGKK